MSRSESGEPARILTRISEAANSSRDLEQFLSRSLDILLEYTHAAAARSWLANPETSTLDFHLHRGLFPETFAETARMSFGIGPAGRAADSKTIVHLAALDELPSLRAKGFVEIVSIPLIAGERVVGVIEIAARHAGELDAARVQVLEIVAPILALAIENAQLRALGAQRETELKRLWQAGLDVAAAPDYGQTLRAIVDRARELVGGEASALCIWDEQKQWWVLQGTSGASEAFEVSVQRVSAREGAAKVECPVVRFKYRQSHLDVPLVHDGRVLGCLCIANEGPHRFSSHERELLTGIAHQAASAVDQARRVEQAGSQAVMSERERLSREMHDTLAQLLGFVSFKTEATRELLDQGRLDLARKELDKLMSISQELYADTRELILGLHTETGSERGLMTALAEYIQRFGQLSELMITLEPNGLADVRFASTVELQLLRVIQEALSNVRKHARAEHVRIVCQCLDETALIVIEDDGLGFDPGHLTRGNWPRFGLQAMRERVQAVDGNLTLQSAPGEGTKITIRVPLVYRGDRR